MILDSAERQVTLTYPGSTLEGEQIYSSVYVGEIVFEAVQGGRGGGLIRFDDPAVRVATSAHLASAAYALIAWRLGAARATKKPGPRGPGLGS